ncbi:hypothetical protein RRG08_008256 [Elysia crispata]|uniref:Uncharacterized protein n=1 Tax=Elysia crispata TaxID=231223 RepID=A0AAE1DJT8_9GAST|nr:hypothetical protein RRG08_008256 [Elysia crispata]
MCPVSDIVSRCFTIDMYAGTIHPGKDESAVPIGTRQSNIKLTTCAVNRKVDIAAVVRHML